MPLDGGVEDRYIEAGKGGGKSRGLQKGFGFGQWG